MPVAGKPSSATTGDALDDGMKARGLGDNGNTRLELDSQSDVVHPMRIQLLQRGRQSAAAVANSMKLIIHFYLFSDRAPEWSIENK
jgi:hypothetical protein